MLELESRLVRIDWHLATGTSLLSVAIDGDAVAGDLTRVYIEPGKHVIEAATVQGKQEKIVDVPLLPSGIPGATRRRMTIRRMLQNGTGQTEHYVAVSRSCDRYGCCKAPR